MRYIYLLLLFCGCSLSNLNKKTINNPIHLDHTSFSSADLNNDMVLDINESTAFINSSKSLYFNSPIHSFSLIIFLVFLFTVICIFISKNKK